MAEARIYPAVGHAGILGAILEAFQRRAPTLADTVAFIFNHRVTAERKEAA